MKQTKILGLLLALLTAYGAYAGDSSSGCGAGWYIFKKNSLVSSSLRATTNGMLLNTVGMTFGTSNCAKHSIVKNDYKAIHFTENSYDQLQMEMATGNGEYAMAFADLMGCSNASGEFLKTIRNNYQQVLPTDNTDPLSMIKNVKTVIDNDQYLSSNCTIM